jgi:hypothetical protein
LLENEDNGLSFANIVLSSSFDNFRKRFRIACARAFYANAASGTANALSVEEFIPDNNAPRSIDVYALLVHLCSARLLDCVRIIAFVYVHGEKNPFGYSAE